MNIIRSVTFVLISVIFFSTSAFAARLKGKLRAESPQNYKVLAVASNGQSRIANVASTGSFTITVKKKSSLHLISTAGLYVGPVLLPKGTKAYRTVSGKSGSLRGVSLKDGFATVSYRLASEFFILSGGINFNKTTGPRGAGNFGLGQSATQDVSLKRVNTRVAVGADQDSDGLPEILDIDDDGDGVMDIVDSDSSTGSAPFEPVLATTLRLDLVDSLNVNTGQSISTEIDSVIQDNLRLNISVRNNTNGAQSVNSTNVDCQSLAYCSKSGGTATISGSNGIDTSFVGALWTTYDTDQDTYPNLYLSSATATLPASIVIFPNVTTAGLQPGNTILLNLNSSAGSILLPALLPTYFTTSPALKEVTSNGVTTAISYPVANNDDGTAFNRTIALGATSVTLTFWPPQRRAIVGAEQGNFIDMGGLKYGVLLTFRGSVSNSVVSCTPEDFSQPSATLQQIAASGAQTDQIYQDSSNDSVPATTNTRSFTLDVAACMTRAGISTNGTAVNIDLIATSTNQDQASQRIWYELP